MKRAPNCLHIFVGSVYFLSNVLLGSLAEANIWAERRASIDQATSRQSLLAQLPKQSALTHLHDHHAAPEFPSISAASSDQVLDWITVVARPFADVTAVHRAQAGAPVVIQLQDIHELEEAQNTSDELVSELAKRAQIKLIGMEGASGAFALDAFRSGKPEITRAVGNAFLKKGFIGGAELAALTHSDLKLWGVEDRALYERNIDHFKASEKHRAEFESELAQWGAELERRQATVFTPELRELSRVVAGYHTGKIAMGDYLNVVAGNENDVALVQLRRALELEKKLDFAAAERERQGLLVRITRTWSEPALVELGRVSAQYAARQIVFSAYDAALVRLCAANKLDLAAFPKLAEYRAYLALSEKIKPMAVFHLLERLEARAFERAATTPGLRELVAATRLQATLVKLARHELTTTEWHVLEKAARANLPQRLQDLTKEFSQFYEDATGRNEALTRNLLNQMKAERQSRAVLVAGGFHTEGVSALLRQKNVSTIVLTPRLKQLPGDHRSLDVFTSEPRALEKMFAGELIELVAPRALAQTPSTSLGQARRQTLEGLNHGLQAALAAGLDDDSIALPPGCAWETKMDRPGVYRVLRVTVDNNGKPTTYRVLLARDLSDAQHRAKRQGLVDADAVDGGQFELADGLSAQIYQVRSFGALWLLPLKHLRNIFKASEDVETELKTPVREWAIFFGAPTAAALFQQYDFSSTSLLVSLVAIGFVILHTIIVDWRSGEFTGRQMAQRLVVRLLVTSVLTAVFIIPLAFSSDPATFLGGSAAHIYLHGVWNALARRMGWPTLELKAPVRSAAELYGQQKLRNQKILKAFGFTEEEFLKFTRAQNDFEQRFIKDYPEARQAIFSMRSQQRFSQDLIKTLARNRNQLMKVEAFRKKPDNNLLLQLTLRMVVNDHYGDLVGQKFGPKYEDEIIKLIREGAVSIDEMVERAFNASAPVLFSVPLHSDANLMAALEKVAVEKTVELSTVWCHPFTEEAQLVGHKVPKKGEEKLVYGFGEMLRHMRKAALELRLAEQEKREPRRFVLLMKNIEAMEPEVRAQLQEILRIRELTHPELGRIKLPENFQIVLTQREGANIEDESFYDRVMIKKAPAVNHLSLKWDPMEGIPEGEILTRISITRREGKPSLVLPNGRAIALDPVLFAGITPENYERMIFEKTGLVLDDDAVRMLAAFEATSRSGKTLVRVEGPTGVGKTQTARSYALLRGSSFMSNPVSEGSALTDLIGGFERNKKGRFVFNGETSFKKRLEEGGVVALSELNTLLDSNEYVSLAWWLVQLNEIAPDADGYKTIRLTEVPVPVGQEAPTIRVHPRTVIVIDTNPSKDPNAATGVDYAARGAFPDIFGDYVLGITVKPLVSVPSGYNDQAVLELGKVQRYFSMFLNLRDNPGRKALATELAYVFYEAAQATIGQDAGIVFSVREIKRICEDALILWDQGLDKHDVTAQVAQTHLVDVWPTLQQRHSAAIKAGITLNTKSVDNFLEDQLIQRHRPVHLRVDPEIALRAELHDFENRDDVIVKYIEVTAEMDRFILEGGLVPSADGSSTIYGSGILGRLAHEAKKHPDKKVVYVFENAHNLRPETAVALNEVLQDGKLYMRGQDRNVTMPANAHIMLVSREAVSWSPAEQSRYVRFQVQRRYSDFGKITVGFEKIVRKLLTDAGMELSSVGQLGIFVGGWINEYEHSLKSKSAYSARLSDQRIDLFYAATLEALEKIRLTDLQQTPIASVLAEAFEKVFLVGLPAAQRAGWARRLLQDKHKINQALKFAGPAHVVDTVLAVELQEAIDELNITTYLDDEIVDGEFKKDVVQKILAVVKKIEAGEGEVKLMEPNEVPDGAIIDSRDYLTSANLIYLAAVVSTIGGSFLVSFGWFAISQLSIWGLGLIAFLIILSYFFPNATTSYSLVHQGKALSLSGHKIQYLPDFKGKVKVFFPPNHLEHAFKLAQHYAKARANGMPLAGAQAADLKRIVAQLLKAPVGNGYQWDRFLIASTGEILLGALVLLPDSQPKPYIRMADGKYYDIENDYEVPQYQVAPVAVLRALSRPLGKTLEAVQLENAVNDYYQKRAGAVDAAEPAEILAAVEKIKAGAGRVRHFKKEDLRDGMVFAATLKNTNRAPSQEQISRATIILGITTAFVAIIVGGAGLFLMDLNNLSLIVLGMFIFLGSLISFFIAILIMGKLLNGFIEVWLNRWGRFYSNRLSFWSSSDIYIIKNGRVFEVKTGQEHRQDGLSEVVEVYEPTGYYENLYSKVKELASAYVRDVRMDESPKLQSLIEELMRSPEGDTFFWDEKDMTALENDVVVTMPAAVGERLNRYQMLRLSRTFFFEPSTLSIPWWRRPRLAFAIFKLKLKKFFQSFKPIPPESLIERAADEEFSVIKADGSRAPVMEQLIHDAPGIMRRVPRKKILVLREKTGGAALPVIPFKRHYGEKPFVFMADKEGVVWLNYNGQIRRTRHTLRAAGKSKLAAHNFDSEPYALLELAEIDHPYLKKGARGLQESDFLLETAHLQDVEQSIFFGFDHSMHVNLEGKAGAGKTSIAREVALLLGLPRTVFQMHGERELADWIGSYREDAAGRIMLTNRPTKDAQGRNTYRQPLLNLLVNGGVFVVDEGAIGEQGRELLSWLSAIVQGDGTIYLEEFPGHIMPFKVHPEFHLIITNNSPEDTQGRLPLKSEIAAHVHFIHVEEDDAPETLEKLFLYFLGDIDEEGVDVAGAKREQLAKLTVEFHHVIKKLIGKELGKENRDRHYVSKREIRRVAQQIRRALNKDKATNRMQLLYKTLSAVYRVQFPHESDKNHVIYILNKIIQISADEREYQREISERFPDGLTADQREAMFHTDEMFDQDEEVLLIAEPGARTSTIVNAVATKRNALVETVDAAPEHTELEILGGLFPVLQGQDGKGRRSKFVRGAILKHLWTDDQVNQNRNKPQKHAEVIVWIRNIDQWSEDIRTSLNGFLEDGYIEIEVDEGRTVRYHKPPHVHFLAEIPSDSTQDFSSAFFNRWIKIGVLADISHTLVQPVSELELTLHKGFDLTPREAMLLTLIFKTLQTRDQKRLWSERRDYQIGNDLLFMVAEALILARAESPDWQRLMRQIGESIEKSGFDPRTYQAQAPPSDPNHEHLLRRYEMLTSELLHQELNRLLAPRLSRTSHHGTSDYEQLQEILKTALFVFPIDWNFTGHLEVDPANGHFVRAEGVPLNPGPDAKAMLQIPLRDRLHPTPDIVHLLGLLGRATQLNRVTAIAGETGAAKTSLAAFFAHITGRRFYKYQTHGNSQVTDLTIDIEQNEDGSFKKRVKEFYAQVRRGDVVVALDEANITPQLLWVLEPFLRGERFIQPIFPEEPAFEIGPRVSIVLTYNPTRYSGRSEIARRVLSRCLGTWMDGPTDEQKDEIIPTFYGYWKLEEPPVDVPVEGVESTAEPAAPAPPAAPRQKGVASEGTVKLEARAKNDDLMRAGIETIDHSQPAQPRTPQTGEKPEAYGIFTPELYPHTRYNSYDSYDAASEEWVRPTGPTETLFAEALSEDQIDRLKRERRQTHDAFDGRYKMDLSNGLWHPLPSAGADMDVWSVEALDENGAPIEMALAVAKDDADNYYIRAPQGAAGIAEIHYVVGVPRSYYGRKYAKGQMFSLAPDIPDEVEEALTVINEREKKYPEIVPGLGVADFRETLFKLVAFFRDFSNDENGISTLHRTIYLNQVYSQCGVCRHRAAAFARTALGLGMEVRYVSTDIHAFVEIKVPGDGWTRIDLGGGGDPANMDLRPLAQEQHKPRDRDNLPEPENYKKTAKEFAERQKEALAAQGLEPQTPSRSGGDSSGDASDGDGSGSSDEGDGGRGAVAEALESLNVKAEEDVALNDDLSEIFLKGKGQTEFIFGRMWRALQSRILIRKKLVRSGLQIDPQAWMLRRAKQFVRKFKLPKIQNTAVFATFDISGSMHGYDSELAYTIASVGTNFWRLREAAPQNFRYDLSLFDTSVRNFVGLSDRMSQEAHNAQIVEMANAIKTGGGTNILTAMTKKFDDFMEVREAVSAKVKFAFLFTDGADSSTVSGGALTPEFMQLMDKYRAAGITVFAIGFGQGANDVQAFNNPGQHFVQIRPDKYEEVGEAIATISEMMIRGGATFPTGDISGLVNTTPMNEGEAGALGFWQALGVRNFFLIGLFEAAAIMVLSLVRPFKARAIIENLHFKYGVMRKDPRTGMISVVKNDRAVASAAATTALSSRWGLPFLLLAPFMPDTATMLALGALAWMVGGTVHGIRNVNLTRARVGLSNNFLGGAAQPVALTRVELSFSEIRDNALREGKTAREVQQGLVDFFASNGFTAPEREIDGENVWGQLHGWLRDAVREFNRDHDLEAAEERIREAVAAGRPVAIEVDTQAPERARHLITVQQRLAGELNSSAALVVILPDLKQRAEWAKLAGANALIVDAATIRDQRSGKNSTKLLDQRLATSHVDPKQGVDVYIAAKDRWLDPGQSSLTRLLLSLTDEMVRDVTGRLDQNIEKATFISLQA